MVTLYQVRTSYGFDNTPWTTNEEEAINDFRKELMYVDLDEVDEFDWIRLFEFDLDTFYDFDFKSDYADYMDDTAKCIAGYSFVLDEEGFMAIKENVFEEEEE